MVRKQLVAVRQQYENLVQQLQQNDELKVSGAGRVVHFIEQK